MFTLAVENTVEVPVKFTLKNKGVARLFSFTLIADRLPQDDISARLEDKERKVKDFMADVITGWSGQRLLLDATGEPAEFSAEALEALLNVAGVASVCFTAYLKECGAKEKN
ncbi:MAG: hypothetical protein Q7U05_01025 [Polaromonas sp.]|nr:hypothetical protein [Polaromonas sp.]